MSHYGQASTVGGAGAFPTQGAGQYGGTAAPGQLQQPGYPTAQPGGASKMPLPGQSAFPVPKGPGQSAFPVPGAPGGGGPGQSAFPLPGGGGGGATQMNRAPTMMPGQMMAGAPVGQSAMPLPGGGGATQMNKAPPMPGTMALGGAPPLPGTLQVAGGAYGTVPLDSINANVTLLDALPDDPVQGAAMATMAANNAWKVGEAPADPQRHYQSNNIPLYPFTWFHGKIDRDQAEEIMKGQPRGAFFVRCSVSKPGCFAVVRQTADGGPTQSFLVEPDGKGYRVVQEPENRFYNNLLEMVELYKPRLRIAIDRKNACIKDPALVDFDAKQALKPAGGHYGAPPRLDETYGNTPAPPGTQFY